MSNRELCGLRGWVPLLAVGASLLALGQAEAGNGFFRNNAVGGVAVNADGILKNAVVSDQLGLVRELNANMADVPEDLKSFNPARKISLRRLQEAILDHQQAKKELPDDIRYLGGLQHIKYVFVYPEQRDIVLVGPAEGWKVSEAGYVVGLTTGRPVMLLDDLLTVMRAANGNMSCSINPSQAGLNELRTLVGKLKTIGNKNATAAAMEKTLGKQNVSVDGVPNSSHLARVLVAADYQMKRLAMGFEPAPVRGLPSFMQMAGASGRGLSNMMPRWWLVPDYDGVFRDADGLSWEFRGPGVQCMTETDYVNNNGNVQRGVKVDPTAQRWADAMTKSYDELATRDPVFGQLQNVMDMAILAALITGQRLPDRAGLSTAVLMDKTQLETEEFNPPKQIDSRASLLKKGRNWLISVSGGVQINSSALLTKSETVSSLNPMREKMASAAKGWWSN